MRTEKVDDNGILKKWLKRNSKSSFASTVKLSEFGKIIKSDYMNGLKTNSCSPRSDQMTYKR